MRSCSIDKKCKESYSFRACTGLLFISQLAPSHSLFQNDGCLNFLDDNDEVLISGFGRRGKAKGDIPGVRFKVVKVSGVGLLALWKEKKVSSSSSILSLILMFERHGRRSRDHKFLAFSSFYEYYVACRDQIIFFTCLGVIF